MAKLKFLLNPSYFFWGSFNLSLNSAEVDNFTGRFEKELKDSTIVLIKKQMNFLGKGLKMLIEDFSNVMKKNFISICNSTSTVLLGRSFDG